MASILEKEWAAVSNEDEIVMKADSESALRENLDKKGISLEEVDIVAIPKAHNSLFL